MGERSLPSDAGLDQFTDHLGIRMCPSALEGKLHSGTAAPEDRCSVQDWA